MYLLTFLRDIRSVARAFRKASAKLPAVVSEAATSSMDPSVVNDIVTQAAGYGFEIGKGKMLQSVLDASDDNPFLDPNWREKLTD